jgi:hypothetical protein
MTAAESIRSVVRQHCLVEAAAWDVLKLRNRLTQFRERMDKLANFHNVYNKKSGELNWFEIDDLVAELADFGTKDAKQTTDKILRWRAEENRAKQGQTVIFAPKPKSKTSTEWMDGLRKSIAKATAYEFEKLSNDMKFHISLLNSIAVLDNAIAAFKRGADSFSVPSWFARPFMWRITGMKRLPNNLASYLNSTTRRGKLRPLMTQPARGNKHLIDGLLKPIRQYGVELMAFYGYKVK